MIKNMNEFNYRHAKAVDRRQQEPSRTRAVCKISSLILMKGLHKEPVLKFVQRRPTLLNHMSRPVLQPTDVDSTNYVLLDMIHIGWCSQQPSLAQGHLEKPRVRWLCYNTSC
jgi:hypothetical protein